MAEQELRFNLVIDAKTGAIRTVEQDLGGVENVLGQKIPAAAKQAENAFSGVGSVVKALGIARILSGAADAAFRSSQSFQELKGQLDITADAVIDGLEPALKVISRGLQGVLVLVQGMIPAAATLASTIKTQLSAAFDAWAEGAAGVLNLVTGNWKAALENFRSGGNELRKLGTDLVADLGRAAEQAGDAISAAGERAQGITKVTLDVQLSTVKETTRLLAANARLSAEERLAIIDRGEKEALALLKQTTKFQTDTEAEKNLAILQLQNEFQSLRKRSEKSDLSDQQQIAQERLQAGLQGIDDEFKMRSELEAANAEQRLALIGEREQRELGLVRTAAADKQITQTQAEQATIQIVAKGASDRAKILLSDAQQTVARRQAMAQALIQSGAAAAANEFEQTKNVGRALRAAGAEQIRTLANQASTQIAVAGAVAAAKSFANAGGFPLGIPAAIATIAFYTALAATVSVAGGAVAGAVAPPAAGGAGGGAPAAGGGPAFAGGGGGTFAGGGDFAGGGGGGGPSAAPTAPSALAGINIVISGADLVSEERAALFIAEKIEQVRRR